MTTEKKMTPHDRSSGVLTFAAIGGMLGTGISWVRGADLLPGLGWGLIWCVIGLMVGTVIYFVVVE